MAPEARKGRRPIRGDPVGGVAEILSRMRAGGYHLRHAEEVALRATLARRNGVRALILEGAPGTGKTALGRALAGAWGAEEIYLLCHHWLSDEELFLGVDVGRVAAGVDRPEDAYRPGALLRAVEASRRGPAVLIVDELDKAPQRAEALLLEYLQSGVVHGPRGERWAARTDNLVVFLTTNGVRPLMEPTLRRGLRVAMTFLPPEVESQILRRLTGARPGVCNLAVRALNCVRSGGESSPSLQEAAHLLEDMRACTGAADVAVLVQGWVVKGEEDTLTLDKTFAPGAQPGTGVASLASSLWGEARR